MGPGDKKQYDVYTRRHRFQTEWGIPILLGLMVIANVVQASRICDLFWPDASRTAYAVQGLVAAIYAMIATLRGHIGRTLVTLVLLLLLVGAHAVFVANSGATPNYNAAITYVPLLSFVALIESRYPVERVLRVLLFTSIAYLLAYIALTNLIIANYSSINYIVLDDHGGEGSRVYLAAAYAAFVGMYGLRDTRLPVAVRILLIALAASALWLSGTRTMMVVIAFVFTLSALGLLVRPVRLGLLGVTLIIMAVLGAGIVIPGWNPFTLVSSDTSGVYRAIEYEHVVHIIQAKWLTGVGTPSDFATLQHYLQEQFGVSRNQPLFASDLGALGAYFEFGLIGLVAFIAAVAFCMGAQLFSPRAELQALQLTCIACALYGIISPLLLVEPSSFFVMLLFAAWWRQRRPLPVTA